MSLWKDFRTFEIIFFSLYSTQIITTYCSKISLESVLEKWDLQDEALRHNQEYLESVYTQRCVLLRLCGEGRSLQGLRLQRAHMNHLERLVHWARNIGADQVRVNCIFVGECDLVFRTPTSQIIKKLISKKNVIVVLSHQSCSSAFLCV